jgi:hypothetical protein
MCEEFDFMINAITNLLGVSKNSYWNYKKQKRPIISFLEKYFTKEDLEEYLQTGVIRRLEEKKLDANLQSLITDDMTLHNAAFKFRILISGTFKMKKIIINVLETFDSEDSTFTVENAKQRLMDRVQGVEKSSIFDTKNKVESIVNWIDDYFSQLEAYIIVKRSNELVAILNKMP